MGHLKKILALVLLFTGCGVDVNPLVNVEKPVVTVGYIDVTRAGDSVKVFVQDGVDFWDAHGIHFEYDKDGSIRIQTDLTNRWLAEWSLNTQDGSSEMYFAPRDYGRNMTCLVAHYLGLAIHLYDYDHNGLTGTGYMVNTDTECPWTPDDEKEVCDYLGCDE